MPLFCATSVAGTRRPNALGHPLTVREQSGDFFVSLLGSAIYSNSASGRTLSRKACSLSGGWSRIVGRSVGLTAKGRIVRGDRELAANEKKKDPAPASKSARGARGKQDTHVSQALRSAYQATMGEDVPKEMMDLLGKLS